MRYTYFTSTSRARCEQVLDDMLASGEVSQGERPRIEHRGALWLITLEG